MASSRAGFSCALNVCCSKSLCAPGLCDSAICWCNSPSTMLGSPRQPLDSSRLDWPGLHQSACTQVLTLLGITGSKRTGHSMRNRPGRPDGYWAKSQNSTARQDMQTIALSQCSCRDGRPRLSRQSESFRSCCAAHACVGGDAELRLTRAPTLPAWSPRGSGSSEPRALSPARAPSRSGFRR